jgi:hypothetical protein
MREIEWPPGSGRTARYRTAELKTLEPVVEHIAKVGRHRRGCRAAASPFDAATRDLAGCAFCRALNELEVLHELKVVFGIDLVEDAVRETDL